ncbi:hypothetical protein [Thioalkalivibrio sp. ALE12]|uniref:hypothetical protein n=1 Tax=Thioalkalivibrio sp. ALE12 TaxID=1158170 RepID=UPI000372753D|nr:hypothetical protein [Thioalkalivibrio sp. ALE12]
MRWLILALALLNLGYFVWVWHDGRLDPDPYAEVPPLERDRGTVELLDVRLEWPKPSGAPAGEGVAEEATE